MAVRIRRTPEQARTHILETVDAYLQEQGPDAFNLKEIAKHAGMVHATILHHFDSVENLKKEVSRYFLKQFMAEAVIELEDQSDTLMTFDRLLTSFMTHMQHDRTVHLLNWLILHPPEPDFEADPENRPVERMLREMSALLDAQSPQQNSKGISNGDAFMMLIATTLIGHLVVGPYVGKSLKLDEKAYTSTYFTWLSDQMTRIASPDQKQSKPKGKKKV